MLESFRYALLNNDERKMKALTGLNSNEFSKLSETFGAILTQNKKSVKNRKRTIGGGSKHTLTLTEKLFFILLYLKTYPTFDVIGAFFKVDRSTACRWVQDFTPILEEALGEEAVLPERQIESVEEFIDKFPEVEEVFIDGTERPTQRSGDSKIQKEYYSGKKKRHTNKNIVISDACLRILALSQTQPGKNHDYALFKEFNPQIPSHIINWVDLGFQGIETHFPSLEVVIPQKKPRGEELTLEQKGENTLVARVRVASEHAIAGIKRLNTVIHSFRNRISSFADTFMLLACGLWNFHLKMSSG